MGSAGFSDFPSVDDVDAVSSFEESVNESPVLHGVVVPCEYIASCSGVLWRSWHWKVKTKMNATLTRSYNRKKRVRLLHVEVGSQRRPRLIGRGERTSKAR